MRRFGSALLVLGCGLFLASCAPARAIDIRISSAGSTPADCVAEVDGRRFSAAEFPALARQWRGREAHLSGDIDTPYRCIGSLIYALQRAGYRRIGFVSRPEPSR
jgi:biopolymer transport protein ExbD